MADADIRLLEKAAVVGGDEEKAGLKRAAARLRPAEYGKVLTFPYCSRCGNSASYIEYKTLIHLPIRLKAAKEPYGGGLSVKPIGPPAYGYPQCAEQTPLEKEVNDQLVTVVCDNAHTWETNLVLTAFEPPPEPEPEEKEEE
jgi:hypothetical protein